MGKKGNLLTYLFYENENENLWWVEWGGVWVWKTSPSSPFPNYQKKRNEIKCLGWGKHSRTAKTGSPTFPKNPKFIEIPLAFCIKKAQNELINSEEMDMSNELIAELAKEMGVSSADVECLARSMANSIMKDRAAEMFIASGEDMQVEVVQAYAAHEVRKINEFHTAYMTRQDVRGLFNDMVYASATGIELKR